MMRGKGKGDFIELNSRDVNRTLYKPYVRYCYMGAVYRTSAAPEL